MAVHFDAVSQGYANATSVTWSHTCTGSDRFLVVGIKLYVPDDITSVTYHGDALTLIGEEVLPAEGSFVKFYGLTAPDTGGSYDVVITRTSANHIVATAASYTGVKQTGQPEAFAAVDNASATDTLYLPVTVTTSGAWLVGVGTGVYSGAAFTGGTAATVVRKDNDLAVVGIECAADSGGPVAPGTRQLTLFRSGSFQSYAGVVAVLAPVTASTGHGVDNFNRADGGLGTNWTTLWDNSGSGAGHQIISNQCRSGGDVNCYSVWNADPFDSDHYSQVVQVNANAYAGPAVRFQAAPGLYCNGYIWLLYFGSDSRLFKIDGGSVTYVASWSIPAVGTTCKLVAQGSTLTGYANGVEMGTATDTQFTGGAPGVYSAYVSGGGTTDDWEGGNLTAPDLTVTTATRAAAAAAYPLSVEGGVVFVRRVMATWRRNRQ